MKKIKLICIHIYSVTDYKFKDLLVGTKAYDDEISKLLTKSFNISYYN